MQVSDFPLFLDALKKAQIKQNASVAAYRAANPGKNFRPLNPAQNDENRVIKAIGEISEGVADGEILNMVFNDAKSIINRGIESVYQYLVRDHILAIPHG